MFRFVCFDFKMLKFYKTFAKSLLNLLRTEHKRNKNFSMENTDIELSPSELGTKKYWDESYSTEIKNYLSHGDTGEIWFDESSQFRVIKWMLSNPSIISKDDSIIDLGIQLLT